MEIFSGLEFDVSNKFQKEIKYKLKNKWLDVVVIYTLHNVPRCLHYFYALLCLL